MPSHIAHALLVESAWDKLFPSGSSEAGDAPGGPGEAGEARDGPASIAVLGAQGPDIFLHNHRRKPRAFRYGAILHRKGSARLLSSLAESAARCDAATGIPQSKCDISAFAMGYISHVWWDRILHPYINYSAGWRGVPDRLPDRPAMHAFLERIIDVQLLRYRTKKEVDEYRFLERLPSSGRDLSALRTTITTAIRAAVRSAHDDDLLENRIANAFFDSVRYYATTESPDSDYFYEGRTRERSGTLSSRWLSVVHPPADLITIDGLNLERRRWQHPCAPSRTSNASVPELFERARTKTLETYALWETCVASGASDTSIRALEAAVGEQNLNDGIVNDPPCRRKACDPLPLIALYNQMKSAFDR